VASVEVLITMSDDSAYSLSTIEGSVIDSCSFNMERGDPPDFGWMMMGLSPPPIVELTVTVAGLDIRFVQQRHPAPSKEPIA
jgi:hypothetical protein